MNISVNKPPLVDYQKAFLYSTARFVVVEASTKAGKTSAALWGAFESWHDASLPVSWEEWWVAPIYDQARIAFNRMCRSVIGKPGYVINKAELSILNPLGVFMRFKSADKPDGLYGENVRHVTWDEFTRAKIEAWLAIRSTLTFTKGRCLFIGNFIDESNWGHQLALANKDEEEWEYHVITAWMAVEAGVLDRKEVEQAQKDLEPHRFKALYECEGSANPRQLMLPEAINALWTNDVDPDPSDKWLTVDVAGTGSDSTVMDVWYGLVVVEVVKIESYVNNEEWTKECAEKVKEVAKRHGIPMFRIIIDNGGMGGGVPQLLPGCVKFNGSAAPITRKTQGTEYGNLRAEAYHKLAKLVNSGSIRISVPDYRAITVVDLSVIRWKSEVQEGKQYLEKKEDMKGSIGRSPDHADTKQQRMLPLLKGTGIMNRRLINSRR